MMWALVWLLGAALVVSVVHGWRLARDLDVAEQNVAHLLLHRHMDKSGKDEG